MSSLLFLTFYDGLYFPKMQILLNKFDMMENLAVEDLLYPSHQRYYKVKMKSRILDKPVKVDLVYMDHEIRDPFKIEKDWK